MSESFTAKDIVSIITACAKSKVSNIKIATIEISFQHEQDKPEQFINDLPVIPASDLKQHVESEADDFDMATDVERMTLMVNDPLAYESLMEKEQNEVRFRETERSISAG